MERWHKIMKVKQIKVFVIAIACMSMCGCSNVGALTPEEQAEYDEMQVAYNKMNYNMDISAYRTTVEYIISNSAMISEDISKDCAKYPLIADTAVTQMFEAAVATENTLGLYDVSGEDYIKQEAKPDESLSFGVDSFLRGDELDNIGEAVNESAEVESEETNSENEAESEETETDSESEETQGETKDTEAEVKPSMAAGSTTVGGTGKTNPDGTEAGEYGYSQLPKQEYADEEAGKAASEAYIKEALEKANGENSTIDNKVPETDKDILDSIDEDAKTDVLDKLEGEETKANPDDLQIDKPEISEEVKSEEKTESKGNYPIYDENLYVVDYGSKEQSVASYQAFLNKPINALLSIEGYKNILVVKVDSKLNGKYMMKLDLDESGKIVKITKYF